MNLGLSSGIALIATMSALAAPIKLDELVVATCMWKNAPKETSDYLAVEPFSMAGMLLFSAASDRCIPSEEHEMNILVLRTKLETTRPSKKLNLVQPIKSNSMLEAAE